ncbi:conserved unknown protein [Ectocarpus siliculosus]|uniref:Impact N-terminal domain-containing protein n=1 Tax=Ectocarpus siliculosus TaxID=2880 RepID=D7FHE6_ECTSI|nr:conserved unknown protein [Ectocarpus siliculosus]|eukprot:CBJ34128.1 conserved unknown protein [Ectocarpus siliculosus]
MLDATAATSAEASSSSSPADQEQIVTVCGESETEETIKKSRFIGRCGPAATFEEGKALLGRVLKEHPKARHSCWAWRGLGDDHRFSDDGEPGGTAGQPILGGIESEGVSELGTGGLCRAYGGASRQCLQAAERYLGNANAGAGADHHGPGGQRRERLPRGLRLPAAVGGVHGGGIGGAPSHGRSRTGA